MFVALMLIKSSCAVLLYCNLELIILQIAEWYPGSNEVRGKGSCGYSGIHILPIASGSDCVGILAFIFFSLRN